MRHTPPDGYVVRLLEQVRAFRDAGLWCDKHDMPHCPSLSPCPLCCNPQLTEDLDEVSRLTKEVKATVRRINKKRGL